MFDFALVEVRLLQDNTFYSSLRHPLRSVVDFFFLYFTIFYILVLILFPLSCVRTIGNGRDQTRVGVLAIGRDVGVALLL